MDALSVRSGVPNVIASKVLALEKTKDGQAGSYSYSEDENVAVSFSDSEDAAGEAKEAKESKRGNTVGPSSAGDRDSVAEDSAAGAQDGGGRGGRGAGVEVEAKVLAAPTAACAAGTGVGANDGALVVRGAGGTQTSNAAGTGATSGARKAQGAQGAVPSTAEGRVSSAPDPQLQSASSHRQLHPPLGQAPEPPER